MKRIHADGYGYGRFWDYRAWEARLSPTMRQSHVAGARTFVDSAGATLEVIDAATCAYGQIENSTVDPETPTDLYL